MERPGFFELLYLDRSSLDELPDCGIDLCTAAEEQNGSFMPLSALEEFPLSPPMHQYLTPQSKHHPLFNIPKEPLQQASNENTQHLFFHSHYQEMFPVTAKENLAPMFSMYSSVIEIPSPPAAPTQEPLLSTKTTRKRKAFECL